MAAICSAIAATIGALSIAIESPLSRPELFANWWTWWQGDAVGIIIVTPLILSWRIRDPTAWPPHKKIEAVCFGLLLLIASYVIFDSGSGSLVPSPLTFLILPFIIWAAFRFSQCEVTTAIAAACAIAVSLGVALFPDHAEGPDSLIRASDEALYKAKAAGRDRVVISSARKSLPKSTKEMSP